MKILILSDFFDDIGGAIGVAKTLALELKRLGHDVGFITTVQEKKLAGKKNIDGIDVYLIYSKYNLFWRQYICLYNPWTVKKIKKIINEFKPDVVHAHNIHIHLSYYALKIAKNSGAKVFLTAHDVQSFHYGKLVEFIDRRNLNCPEGFNYHVSIWQQIKRAGKTYNPLRNLLIRHYLKYANKILAVSRALKDALESNGINNVEVVHNGLNASDWQVSENIVRNFTDKYDLNKKKVVLFGGRLNEAKGSREIILSMKKVVEKIPESVLLVVGKMGKENQMAKNFIVAAGWLSGDELKAAYHVADVVVSPSICFDSFPMVNLEAMACEKPVISTCFGGSKEQIIENKTGYIVNPYNTELLANRILEFLENRIEAEAFGKAGYDRIVNELNLKNMAEKYLGWYEKNYD